MSVVVEPAPTLSHSSSSSNSSPAHELRSASPTSISGDRLSHGANRPVLIHLNADTTWLLSIPYPDPVTAPSGRTRFNILIDPWLQGPQVDGAGWFSKQWHAIQSSVQHVYEIDVLLHDVEQSAPSTAESAPATYIDAVVVSHEFTDHCHQKTLKEVKSEVPVYATTKAAALIRSWAHFDSVVELPPFAADTDWHATSIKPLPSWLGISRLVTQDDALYYHSAVIFCIAAKSSSAEAIIYTPHGVESEAFSALVAAHPPIETLALLHGLHDVSLKFTKQLNLGAHNALKAQRLLKAKYWIGTHDEVKKGGGIIASILRRKAYTLQDALAHEADVIARQDPAESPADTAFVDLGNGERLVLE